MTIKKDDYITMTIDEHIKYIENLCKPFTIGSIIKAIRKDNKINQDRFAKKLNITKKRLSDIENNKVIPSLDLIAKSAKVLGCHYEVFCDILRDQLKSSTKKHREIDISINLGKLDQFVQFISPKQKSEK